MQYSHEWKVPPWVWANLPEYAGHPVWTLWAGTFLRAQNRAAAYRAPGAR